MSSWIFVLFCDFIYIHFQVHQIARRNIFNLEIDYQFNIVILLFSFVRRLCFKTENISVCNLMNLKIYIKSHKNNSTKIQLDLDDT